MLVNRFITATAREAHRIATAVAGWTEAHAVRVGRIESYLPNGRCLQLVATPGDGIAKIVWWGGWEAYEPETTILWYALAMESDVVFDVGANSGFFALLAAHANANASVYAFEPVPRTFKSLQTNVAANPDASVSCHQVAISDAAGTTVIRTNPESHNDLMATIEDHHPNRSDSGGSLVSVACETTSLDEFARCHGIPGVDLVKIDVETAEPRVLAGMKSLIERRRPTILIEVLTADVAAAVEKVARDASYRRWVLTNNGPIETTIVRAHPSLKNYILTDGQDLALIQTRRSR